ncbi:hypothetical protein C1645_840281 [Glomus cerebriforme]|uniref:hAT-like transposase RNase-H fold domain-containing protein n=1 Tax=Glomus cerebriforme TaxID=658196 RepID=A0A397S6K2_9GLOM|nr:hypothetical protein C1645_840281 [Glomus cerebriforme]
MAEQTEEISSEKMMSDHEESDLNEFVDNDDRDDGGDKDDGDDEDEWNSVSQVSRGSETKLKLALTLLMTDDHLINALYPDKEDWISIKNTLLLLKPLERITKYLFTLSYPTMEDTCLIFLELKTYLEKYVKDDSFSQCTMAALISHKIDDY